MVIRLLIAGLLFFPTIALGQVTARFYLEKDTFAPGEPVFLYFEVKNSGTETQNILRADPYSFCSGYNIQISSDPTPTSSCATMWMGGSCMSSDAPIQPGKSYTERILLSYEHKIEAAGYYDVEAVRELPYASADLNYFEAPKSTAVARQLLHFRVDETAILENSVIQSLVEQLKSDDPIIRRDAARALASVAPKSQEDLLLSFADNPEFKVWAPLAFHNLNTPRSLEALGAMFRSTEVGTYENVQVANYLAKSSDPKWYPVLLETAQKRSGLTDYVRDAAQSGGSKMLPVLLQMIGSDDNEYTRPNAVSALGYTGSRAAVPILIDVLRNTEQNMAGTALLSLRQLTHRVTVDEIWPENPQLQYQKWADWWNREGINAEIYKPTQCGEVKRLP
jgi:hypothetical protein